MNALGLDLELLLQFRLGLEALARIGFRTGINFVQGGRQVGQHERVRIFGAEKIAALLAEVRLVALFVNGEEQLFLLRVEVYLFLVGVKLQLRSATSREGLKTAVWRGPSGERAYFDAPGASLAAAASDARWLQYRIVFYGLGVGSSSVVRSVEVECIR